MRGDPNGTSREKPTHVGAATYSALSTNFQQEQNPLRHVLTITMLALTSLVGFAAPASAVGSMSVGDGVLYDDCRDHPYFFSVLPPAGTDSWSMDVTAYGPDGTSQASDFVYDDISTGSGGLQFCGYELAGRYELVAEIEYTDYDAAGSGVSTERLTSTFAMRQPYTRTRLQVSTRSPRYNSAVRFTVKTTDERPSGYFPTSYAEVRLQTRVGSKWVNVRGAKGYTDSRGRDVMTYRWNVRGRIAVRATTLGSSSTAGSTSAPIIVKAR